MSKTILSPEEIENFRDKKWRREETLKIETAQAVEALVEDLGFCLALTDSRTNLPSVYIAVCGRRDVFSPKNVQKDYEKDLAWMLKDEVIQRGRIYYSKLSKGRAMFVAPRLIPYFNAVWGVPKKLEKEIFSEDANKVLKVLRREYEMGTGDLRVETKIEKRENLTKALDQLQRALKVVPQECLYHPTFTYIWTLAEARFPKQLAKKVSRSDAVKELARAFLQMCGTTTRGEFAKAMGLTRKEAGLANQALVKENFAQRLSVGVYRVKFNRG
ncbi:MAG TPA: crosslink repair DNA glycosylase YcaQ family protein [Pyrinomonadaceae bacterium]|nr:crosslink repair DNA glycosylase YcaQ family protein [Pyrinomonadaceae bacterium]